MSELGKYSEVYETPSLEGGKGWVSLLNIIIAVLTALLGAIGASAVI